MGSFAAAGKRLERVLVEDPDPDWQRLLADVLDLDCYELDERPHRDLRPVQR